MLAVAILDNGISNSFNATTRRSIYERDYVFNDNETDSGDPRNHGTRVAESVIQTNARLDLIDARVGTASSGIAPADAEEGFQGMLALSNQGFRIGAINCSFGSASAAFSNPFSDEINVLAARGIFTICASGNSGFRTTLEAPSSPADLANVIAVGSHDGAGNPSTFSQQGRGRTVVLSDGENFPGASDSGTSFSAPQVAATVATAQGTYLAATGQTLSLGQMIDVLQQGGHGPLSAVDPADQATRYYLHDHNGSINYLMQTYVDPNFNPYEYLASYADLHAVMGLDAAAARDHFLNAGIYEGRSSSFDAASYTASYQDLSNAFGADRNAAALHYLMAGQQEGRRILFDANAYLEANADLRVAFGNNTRSAAQHYIMAGRFEGRPVAPEQATNEIGTDFAGSTGTAGRLAVGRSVTGTIASGTDTDWYRMNLTAGDTVVLEARGFDSGAGTLRDPIMFIRNGGGAALAGDDDSGIGLDARLIFTATTTGFHFVEVDGFGTSSTGTYTLSATRLRSGAALAETGQTLEAAEPANNARVALVGLQNPEQLEGYLLV